MSELPIVEVVWTDSRHSSDWMSLAELQVLRPSVITTVGFLVSEDEIAVTIAASIGDTHYGGITVITRCAVKSIRRVKENEMSCDGPPPRFGPVAEGPNRCTTPGCDSVRTLGREHCREHCRERDSSACAAPNGNCINHGACNAADACIVRSKT